MKRMTQIEQILEKTNQELKKSRTRKYPIGTIFGQNQNRILTERYLKSEAYDKINKLLMEE